MKQAPPKLIELAAALSHRIRGQGETVLRLLEAIRRRELDAAPQHGPRGCFIFAGPTGVGKTETARIMAELLCTPNAFLRIDCSEYKTLESFTSLLGDRSANRGRLGRAWDANRRALWLWDEIEKGHRELVHLFLQMADAGRLTLACGETLDLSGIYIVLTTNLGSEKVLGKDLLTLTTLERHIVRSLESFLTPELLGRFTAHASPIVFRPLTKSVQAEIAEYHLAGLLSWHRDRGRRIEVHPDVLPFLIHRGFSPRLGARPLIAFIEQQIGNAVAECLLAGQRANGRLEVDDQKLRLSV